MTGTMQVPSGGHGARYVVPADQIPADDPLPRNRLLKSPGLGGIIKARPGDFLVDELPLYEPSGEGEHLYLGVQKEDMPHSEMVELLARHFNVAEEAVGFAGMKDRIAVTRQAVSIHLPGREAPSAALTHDRLHVLWQKRHANKLRRGHLAGNRFSIRVRGLEPIMAPAVWRALAELERDGIPDYFGSQRFGYRRNTHRLGKHVINRDHEALLRELLGTVSPFPEHQRRQRELFEAGRFSESMPLWGRNDRAERVALLALIRGRSPKQTAGAIAGHIRMFWISAYQSAVFNRVLDRRIADGLFARVMEGDVAYKHASRGQFQITKEILAAEDVAARVKSLEISASGPMLGFGMIQPGSPVLEWERTATSELGVEPETLLAPTSGVEGTRRPFRVAVTNVELDSGFDEHGAYIRLAFDLPRGAYATVLLREIFGDGIESEDDAGRDGV